MPIVAGMDRSTDATPGEPPEASLHRPVLLTPLIQNLQPREGQVAIDGTLGGGGVTAALLDRVGATGRVLAVDKDPTAIARARLRFAGTAGERLILAQGDFAELDHIAAGHGIGAADSLCLDLGTSSIQLDDPARGFSFRQDGPLDMRMDERIPRTAADLLMSLSAEQIAGALDELADEPDHRAIARAVVQVRERQPIRSTSQLTRLIFDAKGISPKEWKQRSKARQNELHPAARTFQALRILVNDELGSLRQLLRIAPSCLRPGGRIGIISFHSGEDRLVERVFNEGHISGMYAAICDEPIRPGPKERFDNPRSASARLRWARRGV